MLTDSAQLIGVLLILAGAVGYLGLYFRRTLKGRSCGCGDCGVPLRRPKSAKSEASQQAPGSQQFLPVENLADLAARRRADRAAESHTEEP